MHMINSGWCAPSYRLQFSLLLRQYELLFSLKMTKGWAPEHVGSPYFLWFQLLQYLIALVSTPSTYSSGFYTSPASNTSYLYPSFYAVSGFSKRFFYCNICSLKSRLLFGLRFPSFQHFFYSASASNLCTFIPALNLFLCPILFINSWLF